MPSLPHDLEVVAAPRYLEILLHVIFHELRIELISYVNLKMSTKNLRIGYVPEHFSTPLHYGVKYFGELLAHASVTERTYEEQDLMPN